MGVGRPLDQECKHVDWSLSKKREKNQHFPRIPVVSNMLPSQFNPHGGCLDKECVCDHN